MQLHTTTFIPLGLCQCGCGNPTKIAPRNRPYLGYVKGQPLRFLRGHSSYVKKYLFWLKVTKTDTCWLWTGRRDKNGYGKVGAALSHRVFWELHNGHIPDGLYVLHHCDNPPCIRPTHLFLGTQADNVRDMAAKGRGKGWGYRLKS